MLAPGSAWDAVVLAVVVLWSLASVIAQVRPARRRLLGWWDGSPLGTLLPVYTFFAPRPATLDLRLVFRHWTGPTSHEWREYLVAPRWRWYHALWNPSKRQGKALSDLVRALARASPAEAELPLDNGYLQLLTLVDLAPARLDATHVQFAILDTGGYGPAVPPRLRLVSRRHVLSGRGRGRAE